MFHGSLVTILDMGHVHTINPSLQGTHQNKSHHQRRSDRCLYFTGVQISIPQTKLRLSFICQIYILTINFAYERDYVFLGHCLTCVLLVLQ